MADALWLPARLNANLVRHDSTILDRVNWNLARHAADKEMVDARAASYLGLWAIADWVAANALADAAFVADTVKTTNTYNSACALADALHTFAYNSYYSDSLKVSFDHLQMNGGAASIL